eukprot:9233758-Lingulodinium_polyedra.AAC.1
MSWMSEAAAAGMKCLMGHCNFAYKSLGCDAATPNSAMSIAKPDSGISPKQFLATATTSGSSGPC